MDGWRVAVVLLNLAGGEGGGRLGGLIGII